MTKHEYICMVCEVVAKKSTCDRAMVGAVFVTKDYEIISTGYNGAPRGFDDCFKTGHMIENGHCIRAVHAEQNAIIQAAKRGTALFGSLLYTTHMPCKICANMIANLGIEEVRYKSEYGNGKSILLMANIILSKWDSNK